MMNIFDIMTKTWKCFEPVGSVAYLSRRIFRTSEVLSVADTMLSEPLSNCDREENVRVGKFVCPKHCQISQ